MKIEIAFKDAVRGIDRKIRVEISEVVTDWQCCDTIFAKVEKDDTADVFKDLGVKTRTDEHAEDDTYVEGELQLNFQKGSDILDEVLLFPVFEYEGSLYNGDFLNLTDTAELSDEARKKVLECLR